MPIIDFHNHFYPPAYLDALRSGSSAVEVTIDEDGNPRIYYPGDYNIAVPGHRDIDYREQVLIEHGVDTQVLTLTTPGTHVETLRHRRPLRRPGQRRLRRDPRHQTRPLHRPRHAPAERSGRQRPRARSRLPPASLPRRHALQQRQRRGTQRAAILAHLRTRQRSRRHALHTPDAPRRRGGDDRFLAHAAGRLPDGHHARRRQARLQRHPGTLPAHSVGALPPRRRDPLSCRAPRPRL